MALRIACSLSGDRTLCRIAQGRRPVAQTR
jgi:hypothetical protein